MTLDLERIARLAQASIHPPKMGQSLNLVGPFPCPCSECAKARETLALVEEIRRLRASTPERTR